MIITVKLVGIAIIAPKQGVIRKRLMALVEASSVTETLLWYFMLNQNSWCFRERTD